MLNPTVTRVYQQMGIVCEESRSRCMPFGESASGYLRQEAVVVIILSNTPQLQAGGVAACAEILGNYTMCGSGASVSSPSVSTQEALYERVAAMATPHVRDDERVAYVECHATGTKAGDEAETRALANVSRSLPLFRRDAATAPPLLIGSVKSSVGHTESASGLIGLVKVLLSLENGALPPDCHYTHTHRNRNCYGLDDGTFKVVTELTAVERDAIAVVNSFGFGGTHTQVMVRGIAHQAVHPLYSSVEIRGIEVRCSGEVTCADKVSKEPAPELIDSNTTGEPWMLINPLLARSEATAYAVARSILACRFSVTVAPPEVHGGEFRARAFTTPVQSRTVTSAAVAQPVHRAVWLVFAGQGGLWSGMGSELYQQSRAYKALYDDCSAYVLKTWQCDAMERLRTWQQTTNAGLHSSEDKATDGAFRGALDATVCLVGVQICLVDLLRRAGVTSKTCAGYIGHSAGEIVAGYFDGCYSRQTTLDIAVLRGQAAQRVSDRSSGAMCAVQGLSREQIEHEIRSSQSAVEVACHTASHQVSVSGKEADVMEFQELLDTRHPHARVTRLRTFGVAFHSQLVENSLPRLKSDLDALFHTHAVRNENRSHKWVSTCRAPKDPTSLDSGSDYHCRGFRECVEFHSACQSIPQHAIIIECGSGATFRSTFAKGRYTYLPLLRLGEDAVETFSTAYGQLFLQGLPLSNPTDQHCSPRVVFPAPTHRSLREALIVLDDRQVWTPSPRPRQPRDWSPDSCLLITSALDSRCL